MAKITSAELRMVEAIRQLGVGDPNTIRRLVIDIGPNRTPVIYVEHYGDENVIQVLAASVGAEIRTAPTGTKSEEG